MKSILLDTVTLSELRKVERMDPAVRRWQEGSTDFETWISVMTPLEIRVGILQVRRRDRNFAEALEAWLENTVLPEFGNRTLGVDLATALRAAEYRAVRGLSPNDSLIAATARVHGLTLATRNVADFADTGIDLVNPWEQAA